MGKIILFIYCITITTQIFSFEKILTVTATRTSTPIKIDGVLSEEIWQQGKVVNSFIQREPNQGEPATQKTEVIVLYDDEALYIGAKLYDTPDSIIATLTRRDIWANNDRFSVHLDPYRDKQTGYYFVLTAAGVQLDGTLFNDSWDDDSWDGVWEGKTTITNEGWIAEIKIPYSQLRFREQEQQIWGINFRRDIARHQEQDYLVYTPRDESGYVSRFPELVGINNIKISNNITLLPYVTAKAEYTHPAANNPFNDGSTYQPNAGVDAKIGLGTNFTLNATINPDFGQVEVDPAVLNLSDTETFFNEKRPFFVEGANIFSFGQGGANNYWNFNFPYVNHFYSRRIGRFPQGSIPDAEYSDAPVGTHILGAGKITGKIGDNWSVGTMQSLTKKEYAELQISGEKSRVEIEPLTYYSVTRFKNEMNEGKQAIGGIVNIVSRKIDDIRLKDEMNTSSLFGGIDGWTFLDNNKEWVVTGWTGMTHIEGTQTQMINIQQNSRHYFQRPDASHVHVDSSATSLTGFAGRMWVNKQKGNILFNAAFGFINPKFEINDIGYNTRTDVINMHIGSGYRWSEPTSAYRFLSLLGAIAASTDFEGNRIMSGIYHFGNITLLNYYFLNWNVGYNPATIGNRTTRGGPLTIDPAGISFNVGINSDDRKSIVVGLSTFAYQSIFYKELNTDFFLDWKPLDNISISLNPNYGKVFVSNQWIGKFEDNTATETFGNRYVFGELQQKTISAGVRINWTFTPQLSLQIYTQPYISSGAYKNFKEFSEPKTSKYRIFGSDEISTITKIEEEYIIDPDGNGTTSFNFSNPDFSYATLRGNAVLRWEYLPGSTLYFVWTQTRDYSDGNGEFQFGHSLKDLANQQPDNIFLIKMTYYLGL